MWLFLKFENTTEMQVSKEYPSEQKITCVEEQHKKFKKHSAGSVSEDNRRNNKIKKCMRRKKVIINQKK